MSSTANSPLKLALLQLSVGADKDANIAHAAKVIESAAAASANLIVSNYRHAGILIMLTVSP
jgi:hypothetical protein